MDRKPNFAENITISPSGQAYPKSFMATVEIVQIKEGEKQDSRQEEKIQQTEEEKERKRNEDSKSLWINCWEAYSKKVSCSSQRPNSDEVNVCRTFEKS